MKVVFMGTPEFAAKALLALIQSDHDVTAVYTQPPRPAHRGKALSPTPVHKLAQEHGLEVRTPLNFEDAGDIVDFKALGAEIAVVAAYGLILPRSVLEATPRGAINIHASLLPRWRGAAPIHRAIMAGDRQSGICIMQMDAGLDTGDVLLTHALDIGPEETTGELHDRLADLGALAVLEALAEIDRLTPTPQPQEGVCYAHKIDKAEARINWAQPAAQVAAHIRGLAPFPGAWGLWQDQRIKFLGARAVEGSGTPGEILEGLTVACADGAVEITRAQRAGKSTQDALDFCRGLNLEVSSHFE